jgi:ATP-dependent DNA helicase RecG
MTATPIPRTLALTIFGDLDISIIKEKPANRQKIITRLVDPIDRAKTYHFIRQQVKEGRQVFVICPRIETAKQAEGSGQKIVKPLSQAKLMWSEVKAVEEEYARLKTKIFPDLKVAMLHGKMKPKEKQQIMHEFKDGWHNILVATSVVEVGVDIPNATIMMIEGADRFGLAQLHQFRGRVGRAQYQSYCFLFPTGDGGLSQRLNALEKSDDGFALAEKDMAIRGPGEFMGTRQSGVSDLAMAALANVDLIKKARAEARLLLKDDPSLKKYPLLAQRLEDFQKMAHFE